MVLENAPILVLDEATSSLDSITEHQIQAALDAAMVGKTVIVIAHRLSTLAHLDRVLVFARGRIVEDAPTPSGSRAGESIIIWRRQSGGMLPEVPRESRRDTPHSDTEPELRARAASIADGSTAAADVV